jgi:hypothetical protein
MGEAETRAAGDRLQGPGHDRRRAVVWRLPGVHQAERRLEVDHLALDPLPLVRAVRGKELESAPQARLEIVRQQPLGQDPAVGQRPPDALRRVGIDHLQGHFRFHSTSSNCSPSAANFSPQNRS